MRKKKKGASLLLVIAITGSLLILCSSLGTAMIFETKQSVRQEKRTQAYYVAKSGAAAINNWLTNMTADEATQFNALASPITFLGNEFDNGTYDIKIIKQSDQLSVEVTGKIANGKNVDGSILYVTDSVTSVLTKSSDTSLHISTAVFGKDKITFGDGKGSPNIYGDVGIGNTNANAIYDNCNVQLHGKIILPPGGGSNIISWQSWATQPTVEVATSLSTYPDLVFPNFPTGLSTQPNVSVSGSGSKTIIGDGYYDSLSIADNTVLTINIDNTRDNIIRVKNFSLSGSINVVGTGVGVGKLILCIDNFVPLKNSKLYGGGSKINATGEPKRLNMYINSSDTLKFNDQIVIGGSICVGATNLEIGSDAKILGDIFTGGTSLKLNGDCSAGEKVVYAPKADVIIDNSANIKGAVVGKTVTMLGNSVVTYTSVDNQIPISEVGSNYQQEYWK